MYHYLMTSAILRIYILVALAAGTFIFARDCQAEPSRLTTAQNLTDRELVFVSKTFENLPTKKQLKTDPEDVQIFEFDETPRAKRAPFLLVHGLRGEHHPYFRWQKVANHLIKDKKFNSSFKIYLARYPTNHRMDKTVPMFRKAIDRLYHASNERQISIMALSIGGNLVYESLTEAETANKVNVLLALGTPFHGSPLFSKDWMQYSLYKKLCWPWTRVDHSLSMRLYFSRNKNLVSDFGWDDYDQAIPSIGKYRSRLPFGPKGILQADNETNERLRKLNEDHPHLKKKIIAYGAYLKNPYLESKAARFIDFTAMYPVTAVWIKFPAHLAREHPVLKLLNRDIASISIKDAKRDTDTKSPFLYALNDGITPISSALFLPPEKEHIFYLTDEDKLHLIRDDVDVRTARVFANIDHLTFIDNVRPLGMSKKIKDILNPEIEAKNVFNWIKDDILRSVTSTPHIAEDNHKDDKPESATQ